MKNTILFIILVLCILSSCIIISTIGTNNKLKKSELTDNIELSCHGPYEYMTKDGDLKMIAVDYILKNGNYKEVDLILRNNIRNCVINFNSNELLVPGNCTDSLLHVIRNTLSKSDTVIMERIIISNP